MEQIILQLAEKYEKPDEFIRRLEKSFMLQPNQEGDFFFNAGITLHEHFYLTAALSSWNRALKCFAMNHDNESR